jgi:hypothetical protein
MIQTVENKQVKKIREEAGKIAQHDINTHYRSCTFDRLGTRFQVIVAKIDESYLVSIPNFHFSIMTPKACDIAYKLVERKVMNQVDAESVEMAINWLMAQ